MMSLKINIFNNSAQNQVNDRQQSILKSITQTSVSKDQTHSNFNRISGHIKKNKKQVDYLKVLKSMKLEQDLRKLRNFKSLQKSMKNGKKEISEIEQQLEIVEQKIVQKKKQIIAKHLQQLNKKKTERQQFIQQSNKQLQMVKQKNEQKRKNIQVMVKELQEKQLQSYQKTLIERVNRYRNPINFQDINIHEKKYLELKSSFQLKNSKLHEGHEENINKKVSLRVKSEISAPTYQNEFQHLSFDHKSRLDERIKDEYRAAKSKSKKKKLELIKLINKRNQYGNKVQQEKKNVRIKTEHCQTKRQTESRLLLESIQKENESKIHSKKPRLNTNLPQIDLKVFAKQSLRKISENKSFTPMQKIEKLKAIQANYMSKNNPEAAQIITELSLIKADLLLKL